MADTGNASHDLLAAMSSRTPFTVEERGRQRKAPEPTVEALESDSTPASKVKTAGESGSGLMC